MFLDAGMVCNMTRLNRVMERRILLYIGNKHGLISYAIGRGPLYEEAYKNAFQELRKNMIVINHDLKFTVASDLKSKFHDYRIYLKSVYEPSYWGNPKMVLMFRYAGLYHYYFIIKSRKKDPYSELFAFIQLVTKNKTQKDISEYYGYKNNNHYIGRPRRYERSFNDLHRRA
jgi:hypothetical protein